MTKYRKTAIIEAEPYKKGMEDGWEDRDAGFIPAKLIALARNIGNGMRTIPYINTLEGRHYITEGDYIITGVAGERYPCKKEIFEKTYEKVSD